MLEMYEFHPFLTMEFKKKDWGTKDHWTECGECLVKSKLLARLKKSL